MGVEQIGTGYEEEAALLRRFRADLDEIDKEVLRLNKIRAAKWQTIQGLESLLRANGVDPDGISVVPAAASRTILESALVVLGSTGDSMGAKEIQDALLGAGRDVNYYTLYRTLTREAEKPNGKIVKSGDKFVLRDTITSEGGG